MSYLSHFFHGLTSVDPTLPPDNNGHDETHSHSEYKKLPMFPQSYVVFTSSQFLTFVTPGGIWSKNKTIKEEIHSQNVKISYFLSWYTVLQSFQWWPQITFDLHKNYNCCQYVSANWVTCIKSRNTHASYLELLFVRF